MKNILIIEDDEAVRDSLSDLFSENKYKVFKSRDGKGGIYLAETEKIDLIICDIMLPEVDGYAVLNALRENESTREIPFIFLTAKAEMSDLRIGMEMGADDYIVKPFKAVDVLKAVKVRLEKSELRKGEWNEQSSPKKNSGTNERFFLTSSDNPKFIKTGDIVYINASGEYTIVHTADGNNSMVRKLLKQWELVLPSDSFVRIHRSSIINLNYVEKIVKWYKRSFRVYLKDIDDVFIISRRYAAKLKSYILK
jgi:DNA-binding LytR/AlgR family response regulator